MRPCCKDSDQCVEKTGKYSQCRPKSAGIPGSWPSGDVFECKDGACDPDDVTLELGVSANWVVGNVDSRLERWYWDELDYEGTTCHEECQKHPDCYVYDINVDGDCTLFGKDLMDPAVSELIPYFDATVYFTKCWLPDPLCDPATREVRKVNAFVPTYWMCTDTGKRDFGVENEKALEAAINICRMTKQLGGCTGFALSPSKYDPDYIGVTLLYARGQGTTKYKAEKGDEVYSIAQC